MADPIPTSATNDTPAKTQKITVTCNELWSIAQQFSYLRLSDVVDENHYKLIGLYAGRARRIAATYARFYLEIEDGGDKSKLGRYYWMALGAFASKTVACLLDSGSVQTSYFGGWATTTKEDEVNWLGKQVGKVFPSVPTHMKNIANGLAQGNLWLFSDIAPTHWFYNHYPANFFSGMACLHKRDCEKLVEPIKSRVKALPWSGKSIGKINNFKSPPELIRGFNLVVQIEAEKKPKDRQKSQLNHLLAIANHEQEAILQKLIYEDPEFAKWPAYQRSHLLPRLLAPDYEIVFAQACTTNDEELKSKAPDDMVVEDFKSRMKWIGDVANLFHGLMIKKPAYMQAELFKIAGWVNSPDGVLIY